MTYPKRPRRHWRTLASTAIAATFATVATMAVPQLPQAFADEVTTTTTTAVPPPGRLAAVQARSARLISRRLASLQYTVNVVQDESYLGSDGTTLVNMAQADMTGLEALGAKIAADTTVQQARADRALIFTQFRVYKLVLPVARDVALVDRMVNVELPALNKDLTELQGLENSTNGAVVAAYLAGAQAQMQVAANATSGLSAQLLTYTPVERDANNSLLHPAQVNIRTAQRAIEAARRYLSLAERYLRRHPVVTTTTSTTSTTTTSTTTTSVPTTTTLVAGSSCTASIGGTALDRTGWTASTNAPSSNSDRPANALDGNLSTRFSTNKVQSPGLYFEVNMGAPQTFDQLAMDVPNSPTDYAGGYNVEVYEAGKWVVVASCTGTGTPEIASFQAQTAQYVAVVLTASNSTWWWSIDEFYLYESPPTTTTTTTVPPTTTTIAPPVPPTNLYPQPCQLKLGLITPGSLVLTRHGAFVLSSSCTLRRVRGVRARVNIHAKGHLKFGWDHHVRLGKSMGHRLVELQVADHQWLRWNGRVYRASSAAAAR